MPKCIKCNYELVLLSNRLKYKCALCSKLYPQKYVENQAFREWNKRQKLKDIENYKNGCKEEVFQLRKLRKSLRLLFKVKHTKQPKKLRIRLNVSPTKCYKRKVKSRLHHYRIKHKRLTELYLKNCDEEVSTDEIFQSPPTFVLADLLSE